MDNDSFTLWDAEEKLYQGLREAGMSLDKLELQKAWDVFKAFCELPIESQSDGILIQFGSQGLYKNNKRVGEEFYFSFLRQVSDELNEEYYQIECALYYELDAELKTLGKLTEWWFKGENHPESLVEFLERHQAGQAFQILKTYHPVRSIAHLNYTT